MHSWTMARNGQHAWEHRLDPVRGVFHTYDAFRPDHRYPERKVHVFVPDGRENGHARQVIYMNDGHTAFFPGGLGNRSWDAARTLASLTDSQAVDPTMIVAVCPVDRNREYTNAPWAGDQCCGVEEYARYLAHVVKPFIDGAYPTVPSRSLLVGSSHGGLAAFYAGLRWPDSFAFVGAMSPSFWVGVDHAERFPVVVPSSLKLRQSRIFRDVGRGLDATGRPRVYIDWGAVRMGGPHNEFIEERAAARSTEMADVLEADHGFKKGRDLFVHEDPDGEHMEESWGRRFAPLLQLFDRQRDG